MYESFYGFKEKPFNLNPDPDYLFMSRSHENAFIHLEYAILENKGFVVITGEVGSGKTTLINFLLRKIQSKIKVGIINNTMVPPTLFIKMICQEFDLTVEGMDQAEMLNAFKKFLLKNFSRKKRIALIIDEAQNLPEKTIEEIRMLSNLESEKQHLIQILLVGQPELNAKLQKKTMKQFAQRVTVSCHLKGLDQDEVRQYIYHRILVAGSGNMHLFDPEAINAVYMHSRGIPRLINIICDSALVYGYADENKVIDKKIVEEVVQARLIGGFKTTNDESPSSAFPPATEGADTFAERFTVLENRISALEKAISNGTARFPVSSPERSEVLEEIILKLIKMLQESIQSRAQGLREIIQQKEQYLRKYNL